MGKTKTELSVREVRDSFWPSWIVSGHPFGTWFVTSGGGWLNVGNVGGRIRVAATGDHTDTKHLAVRGVDYYGAIGLSDLATATEAWGQSHRIRTREDVLDTALVLRTYGTFGFSRCDNFASPSEAAERALREAAEDVAAALLAAIPNAVVLGRIASAQATVERGIERLSTAKADLAAAEADLARAKADLAALEGAGQ